jgi:NADH-quinone oxidoreductase subunit N
MALSQHFAAFFIGLETVSVSLYVLIAYKKTDLRGLEGSLKYLVLAGVSSAFLLFGLAMLYLETGTLALAPIPSPDSPFVLASLAMIFVGIGFKLAIVPFYLWTPDIYQGAPAPVTAFIATISKGAVFVFFVRFFSESSLPYLPVLSWIAIASMLIGNLLALLQDNIKRLLGYSSIAHLGYLLVACIAGGRSAQEAIAFYLVAYFITTLGAFCVITALSSKDGDAELLSSYRGLAWRHPFLAAVLTLTFFSLAGLPISAGFLGKFYLLRAAIFSNLYPLAITLILTSILGLFYYLRVIITLFAREEQELPYTFSKSNALTLLYLTLLLLWLGAYPQGFVDLLSFCALSTER